MTKPATIAKPATKTSKPAKLPATTKQSKLEIPTFLAATPSAAKPKQPSSRKTIQPAPTAHSSKQELIIAMMRQPKGTTIAELMAATGWQAHSVRGILSGVIKKRLGLPLISELTAEGSRRYRITKTVTA
jgi:hypothetical protein